MLQVHIVTRNQSSIQPADLRGGIHSYLTYLRDRLTVARDLLTDSGSIFVQIGDESIANNAEIDVIWEKWQAKLEPLREKLNKEIGKDLHDKQDERKIGVKKSKSNPVNPDHPVKSLEEWEISRESDA